MLKNNTWFFYLCIGFAFFNACTFHNEEVYFEDFNCDTTNITYTDLTYIFTDICAACHTSEDDTPRAGIIMSSYQSVKASIETGKVVPAIEHESKYKMPYGQDKLPDCDIEKIEAWINAGMPEN